MLYWLSWLYEVLSDKTAVFLRLTFKVVRKMQLVVVPISNETLIHSFWLVFYSAPFDLWTSLLLFATEPYLWTPAYSRVWKNTSYCRAVHVLGWLAVGVFVCFKDIQCLLLIRKSSQTLLQSLLRPSESLVIEFNLFTSENSAEQIQVNTLEKPPKSCFVVPLGKYSCVSV